MKCQICSGETGCNLLLRRDDPKIGLIQGDTNSGPICIDCFPKLESHIKRHIKYMKEIYQGPK